MRAGRRLWVVVAMCCVSSVFGSVAEDLVIADFEGDTYVGWQVTGQA